MAKRYSQIFNVSHKELTQKGVFNACVDIDSKLHIDPSLLKNCRIPEFIDSYETFLNYFDNILHIVKYVRTKNVRDRFFKQIVRSLTFKEKANTGLGYSSSGTLGNGIGG